jgi:hypothetical protein
MILTILDLLGHTSDPHQVRVAYHRAEKQLEYYRSQPESGQPVEG